MEMNDGKRIIKLIFKLICRIEHCCLFSRDLYKYVGFTKLTFLPKITRDLLSKIEKEMYSSLARAWGYFG